MLSLSSPVPVAMAMRRFFYPEGAPLLSPLPAVKQESANEESQGVRTECMLQWWSESFKHWLHDAGTSWLQSGSTVCHKYFIYCDSVLTCSHQTRTYKVQFNLIICSREHGVLLSNGSKITKAFRANWWPQFLLSFDKTTTHLLNS